MNKLSIRRRDTGVYEIGPAGCGHTVTVQATNKSGALDKAKPVLQEHMRAHGPLRTKQQIKKIQYICGGCEQTFKARPGRLACFNCGSKDITEER